MVMTTFTTDQLAQLRTEYAKVRRASADNLVKFGAIFDACSNDALKQLAGAQIGFVSKLALNECARRRIPPHEVRTQEAA